MMIAESYDFRHTSKVFVQLNHVWYSDLCQIKQARRNREIVFMGYIIQKSRDKFINPFLVLKYSRRAYLIWITNDQQLLSKKPYVKTTNITLARFIKNNNIEHPCLRVREHLRGSM